MSKFNLLSSDIQKRLSLAELETLARTTKFVQRQSPITGFIFFYICIKSILNNGFASLTESCVIGLEQGIIISKNSLHERFNAKSEAFMRSIFERILSIELREKLTLKLKGLDKFSGLYLQDATLHRLPNKLSNLYKGSGGGRKGGASKSSLKTDLTYNLFDAQMSVEFRNGASSDSNKTIEKIEKGGLYLFDLGYFNLKRFFKLIESDAFFISRYKFKTQIFETKEATSPINVLNYVKALQEEEIKDVEIYLGKRDRLPVRLVLQRVPDNVFEEKKEKIKASGKKKGGNISEERIAFCAVCAFITNLSVNDFEPSQIISFYRIRWQIEILFKAWKSIICFREVHSMNEHRFMCLLYGQMIWVTLNMKIFQAIKIFTWNKYKIEVSELKGYKILKQLNNILKEAIKENDVEKFLAFIKSAAEAIFFFGEKEYRKNQKNPILEIFSP